MSLVLVVYLSLQKNIREYTRNWMHAMCIKEMLYNYYYLNSNVQATLHYYYCMHQPTRRLRRGTNNRMPKRNLKWKWLHVISSIIPKHCRHVWLILLLLSFTIHTVGVYSIRVTHSLVVLLVKSSEDCPVVHSKLISSSQANTFNTSRFHFHFYE